MPRCRFGDLQYPGEPQKRLPRRFLSAGYVDLVQSQSWWTPGPLLPGPGMVLALDTTVPYVLQFPDGHPGPEHHKNLANKGIGAARVSL